jgi:hypothetical protein
MNKDPNAWKNKDKLDFVGNILKIGDVVVALNPYERELEKAKIIKFTLKKVTLQMDGFNQLDKFNGDITTRFPELTVKICKQ